MTLGITSWSHNESPKQLHRHHPTLLDWSRHLKTYNRKSARPFWHCWNTAPLNMPILQSFSQYIQENLFIKNLNPASLLWMDHQTIQKPDTVNKNSDGLQNSTTKGESARSVNINLYYHLLVTKLLSLAGINICHKHAIASTITVPLANCKTQVQHPKHIFNHYLIPY